VIAIFIRLCRCWVSSYKGIQRAGLAAVLAFITSSPEPLLIEKLMLKLITKSQIVIRQPDIS